MYTRRLKESPRHPRGGQISYLLLTEGDANSHNLAITWVEGEPESEQERHAHSRSEQVYVIVAGRGLIHVGDEEKEVGAGTLVFVPAGALHSIRNIGSDKLVYVSATSPPFGAKLIAALYEPPAAGDGPPKRAESWDGASATANHLTIRRIRLN